MFSIDNSHIVAPSKTIHRGTKQNAICFYNDASLDEAGRQGAFAEITKAIVQAEEFIFVSGWTFHPNFFLQRTADAKSIGELLLEKVLLNPRILVAIMAWQHRPVAGNATAVLDKASNDGGAELARIWKRMIKRKPFSATGKRFPDRLRWRASAYGKANEWAHHQRFLVCDGPSDRTDDRSSRILRAFFGGLDMARGRFDWPEHPILPSQELKKTFHIKFDDWYNGEFGHDPDGVREPWHDVHAQVIGPAAWDFFREFVARWCPVAPSSKSGPSLLGDNSAEGIAQVFGKYQSMSSGKDATGRKVILPDEKQPALKLENTALSKRVWKAQLVHSIDRVAWGAPRNMALELCEPKPAKSILRQFEWGKERARFARSIQDAYLEMIEAAERFVYIESPCFVSSGKHWSKTAHGGARKSVQNSIAETLVKRIAKAIKRRPTPAEFHVYMVLPMHPEGAPDDSNRIPLRFLQWCTIEYMVKELYNLCGPAWRNYLSFYFIANWQTSNAYRARAETSRIKRVLASKRYMIYVHSKMMIVDDKLAIIGSANLNERSLNGERDSEICLAMWPDRRKIGLAQHQLASFRQQIWEEHLGWVWMRKFGHMNPGSSTCIEQVSRAATRNYYNFLAGVREPEDGHLLQWPIETDGNGNFGFVSDFIPDFGIAKEAHRWSWAAGQSRLLQSMQAAKSQE